MKFSKEYLTNFVQGRYSPDVLAFASQLYDQLKAIKLDDKSAATGFLYRVDLTDDASKKSMIAEFGAELVAGVELVSRISRVTFSEAKKNIANNRKLFIELSDDISIIIIKLSERLIRLRLADQSADPDLKRLAEEALYFYAPIAQMLGIRKIYQEMEDISFKTLYPDDSRYLEAIISNNMASYSQKIAGMKHELEKAIKQYNITANIQSRVKRPYSIYRKLVKQKIPLEKVYDLLALRVITDTPENCYMTLGVVHRNWMPIDGRFRDWITYPKSNGYRSIQTTVHTRAGEKFEIQIRTEEMHEEAEFGSSAHWAYKQGGTGSGGTWLRKLQDFLDNDEYFDNPYEFFDKLKADMKRDYINVLTPKGDIISLPEGSCPIDYAFAVHTKLGENITGARVNGKFAKLKTELKSGDVVDVISSNSATPSRDWLGIVKTSRARSKILRWFKQNERELFIMQGRNAWEKLKDQHKRRLQGFEDEQKFRKNLAAIGFAGTDEFFYGIAGKSVKCSLFLLKKLYPDAFKKQLDKVKTGSSGSDRKHNPQIKVEGMSNIEIKLSKCCNPIKGEPIVAYITKRSEMKIHSANCSFIAQNKLDASSMKKAEWMSGEFLQNVRFKLFGESYGKLLHAAVEAAESEKLSIIGTSKVPMKGDNECLLLEVEIKDIAQMEMFIKKVKSSSVVESIRTV